MARNAEMAHGAKWLLMMPQHLDSSRQMAVALNSSAGSGIFFQGDVSNPTLSGPSRFGLSPLNITSNSSASGIGASSLVTDTNSAYSNGPQLQRSTSINNDPYMRISASPLSFSSQNISGTVLDQNPHQDQLHSVKQEPGADAVHIGKKPRLNMRQEEALQQQFVQQMLQRQEGNHNTHLNAIMQKEKMAQQRHQQEILQSMPHMQRAPMMSQQLRSNLQVQMGQSPVRSISDNGLCSRRLMQYMYHQGQRPSDNSIMYWRKFVDEYFAPKSTKRWCLSQYDKFGGPAFGAFPQSAMDARHCGICGSTSAKGFEATYEVLPRLNQILFDRGMVDELLYLDMPREYRLASGMMVLEYSKAIQESVYVQLRVVREGQLRITFTPDLKILSWEFCVQRHEEFFSRRAIAPQVNQLLQVAQKYQTAANENGTAGVPLQDMQASCNMFLAAGRNLVRNLDMHALNEMGFSKRYVRCLQISEVVNGMKDLIDFSNENKIGAIESLKKYPRLPSQKKSESEHMIPAQNMQADQTATLNKIMAMQNSNNPGSHIANGTLNYSAAPNNYSHIMRLPSSQAFLAKVQSASAINFPNQTHVGQANRNPEQNPLHQILRDMINNQNKRAPPQQTASAVDKEAANGKSSGEVVDPSVEAKGGAAATTPNQSVNNNSSSSSSNFSDKHDTLPNLDLSDLDRDILQEFEDSGIQW